MQNHNKLPTILAFCELKCGMLQLEANVVPCKFALVFRIQCYADTTNTFVAKNQGNENSVKRLKFKVMKWMLLKRGMGNGEWGMGNGEWGMGNGEWGMGNGE